jgi:hypothetical protein
MINSGVNSTLKQLTSGAPAHVIQAIEKASANTGVDFAYLVQQAKAESSFNPDARAKTSSASGLYQFIRGTWLDMVERHGEKYGIDVEAMSRQELLDLRFDPEIASHMAAEFASENKAFLDRNWGGEVGPTEMYFAHFLGAGGAASFLRAKDQNPMRVAADIFPEAAKANRNVFYDSKNGRPRSIGEVYDFFDRKFSIKGDANPMTDYSKNSGVEASGRIDPRAQSSLFSNALMGGALQRSDVFINGRGNNGNNGYNNYNAQNAMGSIIRQRKTNPLPLANLVQSPVQLMILAEMDAPQKGAVNTKRSFNR